MRLKACTQGCRWPTRVSFCSAHTCGMLGCSGRGGRGEEAAGTAGSSSSARATVRQAECTSARTGIVRAVALALGPRLSGSQAAGAVGRAGLHARHAQRTAEHRNRAALGARREVPAGAVGAAAPSSKTFALSSARPGTCQE